MSYRNFEMLFSTLRQRESAPRVLAVVAADDVHTLEAVQAAAESGLVRPLLLGDPARVEKALAHLPRPLPMAEIISCPDVEGAARKAGELVRDGQAHIIMKGGLPTPVLMKALLDKSLAFRTGSLISHLNFIEIPTYHKLIAVTDGALLIAPTLEQKKGALENAVRTLHRMGVEEPKVAVLAAAENVNPKMPETVDAAALKELCQKGELPRCLVDGPLSYDLAISREAAEIKKLDSAVCGDADILLVPHIVVGNVLIKALRYSAKARTAAIVVGGRAPLILPSRATDADNKFLPIALAALAGAQEAQA